MKKIFQAVALGILTTVAVSCGSDDEKPSNSFNVVLDGETFKEEEIMGYIEDDLIVVMAYKDNDAYFGITIDPTVITETGTYSFDETEGISADFYVSENFYSMISGEIKITKLSEKRFEATFSGTAEDFLEGDETLAVTDGSVKADIKNLQ